ncbi:MAG: radical SAM protein, partial [Candidatus Cloacimonadaceae bacterium]|nr:radical SAM protein [Candidatus Cloacimonadaceae bacterium]
IDVFFIGEAEEAIIEITEVLHRERDRSKRLSALAEIDGCFVPSVHGAEPDKAIHIRKFNGFATNEMTHRPQLLPWQLATHNRYVAEIMRGCTRGCRFCHAGYFYRPVRERNPQDILNSILDEIKSSGWDEAGLVSLSSSDYTCIRPLLKALLERVNTDKTHISLPSLRVDNLDNELIEMMKNLGREGLTIAPEAGSQRLRDVINKNLSEEEILAGIDTALQLGWQKVKLYFMIGLPYETEEDIDAIIDLITCIDSKSNRKLQINVTLSPFVPKPFTPFQWHAMASQETLLARCLRIKNTFTKRKYIKIKYHTIENSILEALITRADVSFSAVIHEAWKGGAIFDAWNEHFDYSKWQKALTITGKQDEAEQKIITLRDTAIPLPWSFIDIGVTEEFLLDELQNAQKALNTPDCREGCIGCGICDSDTTMRLSEPQTLEASNIVLPDPTPLKLQNQIEYRYRVYYKKVGVLRF